MMSALVFHFFSPYFVGSGLRASEESWVLLATAIPGLLFLGMALGFWLAGRRRFAANEPWRPRVLDFPGGPKGEDPGPGAEFPRWQGAQPGLLPPGTRTGADRQATGTLLAGSPLPVLFFQADGQLIGYNPAAAGLVGPPPEGQKFPHLHLDSFSFFQVPEGLTRGPHVAPRPLPRKELTPAVLKSYNYTPLENPLWTALERGEETREQSVLFLLERGNGRENRLVSGKLNIWPLLPSARSGERPGNHRYPREQREERSLLTCLQDETNHFWEQETMANRLREAWMAMEYSHSITLVLGPDRRIEAVNRLFPHLTREMVLGQPATLFTSGESRRILEEAFQIVDRNGQAHQFEIFGPGADPDAPEVRYSSVLVPVPTSDNATRYLLVAEDLSDLKAREEEIRQLHQELEKRVELRTGELRALNRELEAFAYSVSHDLRAPVRHINGFIQLLTESARPKLDDQETGFLDRIQHSGQHMARLIDDLLAYSRMGRKALEMQFVDFNRIIASVVLSLEPDLRDRAVEWDIAQLPEVRGDPAMLRQVWENLISNALKYSQGANPARIEIGWQNSGAEDHFIFSIRDNGVGFNMEYLDKLFRVFHRLHGSDFEGTGIGLANVRRIIERHNGEVWAISREGQGASFYFQLPAD